MTAVPHWKTGFENLAGSSGTGALKALEIGCPGENLVWGTFEELPVEVLGQCSIPDLLE
jgi:hypothetical protein